MEDLKTTTTTLDKQLRAAVAANPLDALTAITEVRVAVADVERDAVYRAVDQYTWAEIGAALGVSKQAAFQRFGKQWVVEGKAAMKAAGTVEAKRAFGDRVRRALK